MRTSPALWFYLFFLLGNGPFGAVANVCSRSLPSPSNNGSGSFTGGVQLLIPSWTFSCQGVIDNWFAHVIGNTSVTVGSGIEFQVLKPDPVKSNVYSLIYGNTYGEGGESATGSRIELKVLGTGSQVLLPVRPGYIVGVYIDSNAVNKLSLIHDNTAEDIDIYYWENLTGRLCNVNLSLCDAKVMRGVRPLIGWIFRNVTVDNFLSNQETTVQLLRSNSQYCNETEVSLCPTMSSTLIQSPSLSSSPSVTSSATPSSSPTDGSGSGNGGGGIFEDLSIQVVAVLGVIVILLLLVIILSLIICICCLCRSKTGIEVSGSVENPGYDGKYELRALPVV
ncbi:PREDICTED: uncharacterized protein LOC109591171 isoform X2 [Amphimedon queenslandica]|uniref:Uncharacterized protein n=1 Tax=Amphimedon queenslandica TaxID=400682 RepID=A0A1X7SWI2_AMPQE|nr:PREDICTED: uncharacterized protein LOC109591171 isoform X2 [Amphimedon queenslandica]|eukprot:XP_019862517.1 PREDICTED: uncharacterized protein LOC109591171 isoform X2 [Amphimedon queenslandica]